MSVPTFADRLARVRQRFVSTLDSKIDDAYSSIAGLADGTPSAPASIAATYRSIHGVVGVGPTVGFPSTGQAARAVEELLHEARQRQRGLTADEILHFKKCLHALRQAADRELEFFYSF